MEPSTTPVNAIDEEERKMRRIPLRTGRKLWRRIPAARQRPNTKRYREIKERGARARIGSFSSTCRLHLFPYVYISSPSLLSPE